MLRVWFDEDVLRQLQELDRKLTLARRDLDNRIKPHRTTRDYMKERWAVNFDSQGSIYGAWRPLRPWTVILRGSDGPILNRTGTLRSGFMSQAANPTRLSRDVTLWIFKRNPRYLFAQHFGNMNRSSFAQMMGFGPVPARPIWGLNGEDEQHIHNVFEQYCDEVIARYF